VDAVLWTLAVFLFLNILAGLVRVLRGPTPEDRLAASMLFGSTGVALLLVIAQALGEPAIRDVALIFVLLAVVVTVVFGQSMGAERAEDGGRRDGSP